MKQKKKQPLIFLNLRFYLKGNELKGRVLEMFQILCASTLTVKLRLALVATVTNNVS